MIEALAVYGNMSLQRYTFLMYGMWGSIPGLFHFTFFQEYDSRRHICTTFSTFDIRRVRLKIMGLYATFCSMKNLHMPNSSSVCVCVCVNE